MMDIISVYSFKRIHYISWKNINEVKMKKKHSFKLAGKEKMSQLKMKGRKKIRHNYAIKYSTCHIMKNYKPIPFSDVVCLENDVSTM